MATGRRLFDGATTAETIATVLTREPDLDAIPPPFGVSCGCVWQEIRERDCDTLVTHSRWSMIRRPVKAFRSRRARGHDLP